MKRSLGLALFSLMLLVSPTRAAEYQGKNIDGRKLDAQAYSYETGGSYRVQVRFKEDRATLYFVGGTQKTIKLNHERITSLDDIEGYGIGPFGAGLGGILFSVGIANSDLDNPQPPPPQPLTGLWRISLQETQI